MNPATCPNCGAVAGRAFCAVCGAPLPVRPEQRDGGRREADTATGPLPTLPSAPRGADPFTAGAAKKATKGSGPTPTPTPTPAAGDAPVAEAPPTRASARPRWLLAGVSAAVLLVLAAGAALVLAGRGDGDAADGGVTAGAGTDPGAPATTATGPGPAALRYRHHVGRYYEVEVPDTWQTTYEDRLTSRDPESLVSRWEDPFRAVLSITTSSPITGTVADDCTAIFDDRARSSVLVGPENAAIPGRETCTFAYVRPDQQVRVEHLFAVGDREFLVTAGSGTQEEASAIAEAAAGTLEPR